MTNDYLWITPDSVRIYVDTTQTKGTKGGFAVGGFTPGKGDPTNFVHLTPDNYFIGHQAGSSILNGVFNSFIGYNAGFNTTDGSSNVFIGHESGLQNSLGNWNVFMGSNSGNSNTSGSFNVFLGDDCGIMNTTGQENVFIGESAGYLNEDGNFNTFLGTGSGYSNVSGAENVYIGELAGASNIGNQNVMLGSYAGHNNVLGQNNVFIGYGAGLNEMGSNSLYIDNAGKNWDEALIYGNFDTLYLSFFANLDVAGDILANDVTVASDLKWKENIIPYKDALNQVSRLQGVTYDWKVEESTKKLFNERRQIGLIAQDVEAVIPELVRTGRNGDKSLNYSKLTVVLLEALKEQQKMIEELQREVELLKHK